YIQTNSPFLVRKGLLFYPQSVIELLSSRITTQKLQVAHLRHPITLTMPVTVAGNIIFSPHIPAEYGLKNVMTNYE
ncbi:hypothetical protein, partial [Nostoc cycadae]|uniref:hypothetical protein n=1 Tax=Nostoc cycadae TaxID=246795 RepID=UPI001C9DF3B0